MDADLKDLILLGHDLVVSKYLYLAGTVVLFYDIFLTLADEIELLWKPKKTYISYLALIHRYFTCVACLLVNYTSIVSNPTAKDCRTQSILQLMKVVIVITTAQIFMMLRVYAVSGGKRYTLYLFSALTIVEGVLAMILLGVAAAAEPKPPAMFATCSTKVDHTVGVTYLYVVLSYDIVIFFVTLIYSYKSSRGAGMSRVLRNVVRDGTMYFFCMFALNLSWVFYERYAKLGFNILVSVPNVTLTSILISRFTLSLRKAGTNDPNLSGAEQYPLTVILFNGAPLVEPTSGGLGR